MFLLYNVVYTVCQLRRVATESEQKHESVGLSNDENHAHEMYADAYWGLEPKCTSNVYANLKPDFLTLEWFLAFVMWSTLVQQLT